MAAARVGRQDTHRSPSGGPRAGTGMRWSRGATGSRAAGPTMMRQAHARCTKHTRTSSIGCKQVFTLAGCTLHVAGCSLDVPCDNCGMPCGLHIRVRLAWLGLAWLGLAWLGLAGLACRAAGIRCVQPRGASPLPTMRTPQAACSSACTSRVCSDRTSQRWSAEPPHCPRALISTHHTPKADVTRRV